MVYRSRLLFATAFVAVLIAGVPAAASAQNHPRLGLYGAVFGDGYPLWNSSGVPCRIGLAGFGNWRLTSGGPGITRPARYFDVSITPFGD